MFKKGLSLLLVVIMMFSLSGCSDIWGGAFFLFLIKAGDDRGSQDDIFKFVREEEKELLNAIETGDFSVFENQGFIKRIDAYETVVDFYCGGYGMGPSTSYVGFYYTPNHDMSAMWCVPSSSPLIPSGNGFEWMEPNGDNRYYTEHICGNFYYYEASF